MPESEHDVLEMRDVLSIEFHDQSVDGYAWGGPCPAASRPALETEPSTETKKARDLRASDVPCLPVIGQGMTPTGIEPVLPP